MYTLSEHSVILFGYSMFIDATFLERKLMCVYIDANIFKPLDGIWIEILVLWGDVKTTNDEQCCTVLGFKDKTDL